MPGQSTYKYGARHRNLRAEYSSRMVAGEEFDCWRCGKPIDSAGPWDLGHDDDDPSLHRGPEHTYCNRSRGRRSTPGTGGRDKYGPARSCEICGTEYSPSYHRQRTCGNACGIELKRRNHDPVPRSLEHGKVTQVCPECGQEFQRNRYQLTCSRACSDKRLGFLGLPKETSRSKWQRLLDKNRKVRK